MRQGRWAGTETAELYMRDSKLVPGCLRFREWPTRKAIIMDASEAITLLSAEMLNERTSKAHVK